VIDELRGGRTWIGVMLCGVLDDLQVTDRLTIPAAELAWRFSRSSGPGGQGVNTTDSRVELSWDVTGSVALPPALRERAVERLGPRLVSGVLTIAASEHRSQWRNREAAAARLIALVAAAIAAPPQARRPTRPSRGSVERRIAGKKRRAETKRNRRPDHD
jgi:ribosome-associated protein